MIFATSLPRFKTFLGNFVCKSTDLSCCLLFITPFILPACRRSVAAAARSVLNDVRDAGWLLRWLGGSSAPAALLAAAQNQLLHAARDQADRLHVLAIDSTMHGQQGQHTQNTYSCRNTQKRPSKSQRHQKKFHRRSEHCFVFALLLTPNGLRIPYWLPFYTKQHCEIFGRKHCTQADLAAQLIDRAVLATTEQLLTWFSLRWQIELFFREMKSDLGMCQYKLGMFARVVGWVNLSVVSFCYLEWYRWQEQQEATGKDKPFWQRLRTAGLKEKVRQQVQRAELEALLRVAAAADGQQRLRALLDKMGSAPAGAAVAGGRPPTPVGGDPPIAAA